MVLTNRNIINKAPSSEGRREKMKTAINALKQFNDLNDVERSIIREYNSYKKMKNSDLTRCFKTSMLAQYRERAKQYDIEHLI